MNKLAGLLVLVILGTTLIACDASGAQEVEAGDNVTLAPGESATFDVEGRRVEVTFTGVLTDSRCPIDVVCIQMGDALVSLVVAGATVEVAFPVSTEVRVAGVRVVLTDVQPSAKAAETIEPDDYRITLLVESD
jgi:hypothetical protein